MLLESTQSTQKQFDSSGEIQIAKDFFFNSIVTCNKEIGCFFSILFVAMSHYEKDLFCLSHWITATDTFFCCTESLQPTQLLYVLKKGQKMQKLEHKKCTNNA